MWNRQQPHLLMAKAQLYVGNRQTQCQIPTLDVGYGQTLLRLRPSFTVLESSRFESVFGSGLGHFWGRFSHCAPVQRPLMRHTFSSTRFSSTVNCRHVLFVVVCHDWMLRFLIALMPTGVVSIVFRLAMFPSKRIRD